MVSTLWRALSTWSRRSLSMKGLAKKRMTLRSGEVVARHVELLDRELPVRRAHLFLDVVQEEVVERGKDGGPGGRHLGVVLVLRRLGPGEGTALAMGHRRTEENGEEEPAE